MIAATSAPVSTSSTPGAALAFDDVDLLDARMRMRGQQHHAVAHAGQRDVVDIAPRPGEEPLVLDAPHRLPDSELGHFRVP